MRDPVLRGGALRFACRRLLQAVPVLVIVAVGVFLLVELAPGDAVDAYVAASGGGDAGYVARLREEWGLSGSPGARFASYLVGLATLDLGRSVAFDRPVVAVVVERIPVTLLLTGTALALSASLGTLMGVAAARRPGSATDALLTGGALVLNATPGFLLGLALIILLSVKLALLPLGGIASAAPPEGLAAAALDRARHLVMPVAALALTYLAVYQRLMRGAMIAAAASDYARTARAKGLAPSRILWRHLARNAVLPVVTMVGVQAGTMLGGSVAIETVFAIPGLGRLAYEAVAQRDLPLLAGVILAGSLCVIVANILADLAQMRLDPRIGP